MITIEQMKAEVDRHLEWMVRPGGPGPQKSFDPDDGWADATFLVNGDEVSVSVEEEEDGVAAVHISVYEPNHSMAFRKILDIGEDLEVRDREYIINLLDHMGTQVKFPVAEYRKRWTS